PYCADAWGEIVLVGRICPARHAGIAGIDETDRRIGKTLRLHARMECVEGIVLVDERLRQFVAYTGADGQVRTRTPLVLRVHRGQPAHAILRLVRCRPSELRRHAEEEVRGSVARVDAVEREVAVRPV